MSSHSVFPSPSSWTTILPFLLLNSHVYCHYYKQRTKWLIRFRRICPYTYLPKDSSHFQIHPVGKKVKSRKSRQYKAKKLRKKTQTLLKNVLIDVLNTPDHVLLLHPEKKFLIIIKVWLSSDNSTHTLGRFTSQDILPSPTYGNFCQDLRKTRDLDSSTSNSQGLNPVLMKNA